MTYYPKQSISVGDALPNGSTVLDIWKNVSGGHTVLLDNGDTMPLTDAQKLIDKARKAEAV